MSAEIGSSVGNNQAAFEEQRKKQEEAAAAQKESAISAQKNTENSNTENAQKDDAKNSQTIKDTIIPGSNQNKNLGSENINPAESQEEDLNRSNIAKQIPGYRENPTTTKDFQENSQILIDKVSKIIEDSKTKLSQERDLQPAKQTELSDIEAIAKIQISQQKRQEEEASKTEAQKINLSKTETVLDKAKELTERGLYGEAEKLLGESLFRSRHDEAIKTADEAISAHRDANIAADKTKLEQELKSSTQKTEDAVSRTHERQENKERLEKEKKKIENAQRDLASNARAYKNLSDYKQAISSAKKTISELGASKDKNISLIENQKVLDNWAKEADSSHKTSKEQTRTLSEAKALEAQGDKAGAEAVLKGEAHTKKETVDFEKAATSTSETSATEAKTPEQATNDFRENLAKQAQEEKIKLDGMMAEQKAIDTKALSNPKLSAAEKQTQLAQSRQLESKIQDQARKVHGLQEFHKQVTHLQDEGKHDEAKALAEGKTEFKTEQKYNDADNAKQVAQRKLEKNLEEKKDEPINEATARLTDYQKRLPNAEERLRVAESNSSGQGRAAINARPARDNAKTVRDGIVENIKAEQKNINQAQEERIKEIRQESEAQILENLGDTQGAKQVREGKSYERNTEIPTSLSDEAIKTINEAGLSPEQITARNQERASLSEEEQIQTSSQDYRQAISRLSVQGQQQIKGLNEQIDFLRNASITNPNLSAEQRQEFLRQEREATSALQTLSRETDELQKLQAHVTELLDQGKHDEIAKLKNGETNLTGSVNFNDAAYSDKIASDAVKLTQTEETQEHARLNEQINQAKAIAEKYGARFTQDGKESAAEAKPLQSSYLVDNVFDKHLGERLSAIADAESSQGMHLSSWGKFLESSQKESQELIQQGKLTEARELLQNNLLRFTDELKASQLAVAKERSDPAKWQEVQQGIEESYKNVRNAIVMTGAAIVTGGVAANFMGGGTLLTGGAVGATKTSLTGLAATKAFGMGVGVGTGTAFIGETAGSMASGQSFTDSVKYAKSQVGENLKNSVLGSLGAVSGAGLGGRIASRFLSSNANKTLAGLVEGASGGAAGAVPGVIDDVATKITERQTLINELRQSGKSQAEIDQELTKRKLDFQSMSVSAGAALASGIASGTVSRISDDLSSSLTQNTGKIQSAGIKSLMATGEEIVQTGIAAAETSVQGYVPGTKEFEQAMIANMASLVPSRIGGALSSANTDTSKPKNKLADNINKQELQVRVNPDLPKAQQALKNQIDTTLADGHEELTNTLNNIAGYESNEVIQSKIDQLKEAIKFSEKSSDSPDTKKLIDEQVNDQLSELNHMLARRANLSSTDSSTTKGLNDIINSQNIKPEASEKFNAIAQHLDQGIKLLQQGLYEEAQAHLSNETKAKELGINLENKFLDAKNLDTQQAVTHTIDFSAFGSRHRDNNINLVNLNFHGQRNDFAQNSPNEYNRLQQNQALVHLEEWLHNIQDLTVKGSITDKYSHDHELDVAHTIETLGIKLSPEFLDRYGRNVLLEDRGISTTQNLNPEIQAQTKVRVEPDGRRSVTVDLREGLTDAAKQGDAIAQKTILEETTAHARENPIDPQVKQTDGSYKVMSRDQYHALRARQELAMRSVAEAKFAQATEQSVSATKQDSKTILAEMNQAIKSGNYTRALELAQKNGVGEIYRKQFDADYKYNANRDRTKDALEQTSFNFEAVKSSQKLKNSSIDLEYLNLSDDTTVFEPDTNISKDNQIKLAQLNQKFRAEEKISANELNQAISNIDRSNKVDAKLVRSTLQSSLDNLIFRLKNGEEISDLEISEFKAIYDLYDIEMDTHLIGTIRGEHYNPPNDWKQDPQADGLPTRPVYIGAINPDTYIIDAIAEYKQGNTQKLTDITMEDFDKIDTLVEFHNELAKKNHAIDNLFKELKNISNENERLLLENQLAFAENERSTLLSLLKQETVKENEVIRTIVDEIDKSAFPIPFPRVQFVPKDIVEVTHAGEYSLASHTITIYEQDQGQSFNFINSSQKKQSKNREEQNTIRHEVAHMISSYPIAALLVSELEAKPYAYEYNQALINENFDEAAALLERLTAEAENLDGVNDPEGYALNQVHLDLVVAPILVEAAKANFAHKNEALVQFGKESVELWNQVVDVTSQKNISLQRYQSRLEQSIKKLQENPNLINTVLKEYLAEAKLRIESYAAYYNSTEEQIARAASELGKATEQDRSTIIASSPSRSKLNQAEHVEGLKKELLKYAKETEKRKRTDIEKNLFGLAYQYIKSSEDTVSLNSDTKQYNSNQDGKKDALKQTIQDGSWAETHQARKHNSPLGSTNLILQNTKISGNFKQESEASVNKALEAIEDGKITTHQELHDQIANDRRALVEQELADTKPVYDHVRAIIAESKKKVDDAERTSGGKEVNRRSILEKHFEEAIRNSQYNPRFNDQQKEKAFQALTSFKKEFLMNPNNYSKDISNQFTRFTQSYPDFQVITKLEGLTKFGQERVNNQNQDTENPWETGHRAYDQKEKIDAFLNGAESRINYGEIPQADGSTKSIPLTLTTTKQWFHTDPKHFPEIKQHLDNLYKDLETKADRLTQDQKIEKIAQIYWWNANAMFSERGSAAIANTQLEVMLRKHGIETMPFKEGSRGDLDAFMTSEKDFVSKFANGDYGRAVNREAQTEVKLYPNGRRETKIEYASKNAAKNPDIVNEENRHAGESHGLIDPIVRDSEGNVIRKMSSEEYQVRRAEIELKAKYGAANDTQRQNDSTQIDEKKRDNYRKIREARQAVDKAVANGDPDQIRALSTKILNNALKAGLITGSDIYNFEKNFKQNIDRNLANDPLVQTSNNTVDARVQEYRIAESEIKELQAADKNNKSRLEEITANELANVVYNLMLEIDNNPVLKYEPIYSDLFHDNGNVSYSQIEELATKHGFDPQKVIEDTTRFLKDNELTDLASRFESTTRADHINFTQLKKAISNARTNLEESRQQYDSFLESVAAIPETLNFAKEFNRLAIKQGLDPIKARSELSLALKENSQSNTAKRLDSEFASIDAIRQGEDGKVRTEDELTVSDIQRIINDQQLEITANDIEDILSYYQGEDRILAERTLSHLSQFANPESIIASAQQLQTLLGDKGILYSVSHGGMTDLFDYMAGKGFIEDSGQIRTFDNPENALSAIYNAKKDGDGTIPYLIADRQTLEMLAKAKESNPLFVENLKRAGVRIINPEAWNNGANLYSTKADVEARLDSMVQEIKDSIDPDAELTDRMIRTVINQETKNKLHELGFNIDSQRGPMTNIFTLRRIDLDHNNPSAQSIADNFAAHKPSPEEITARLKQIPQKEADRQAVALEILARQLQVLSAQRRTVITQDMHKQILQKAKQLSVDPENIVYYIPQAKQMQSAPGGRSGRISTLAYAEANGIPTSQITSNIDGIKSVKGNRLVVMLDDFSGSGGRAKEYYSKLKNLNGHKMLAPIYAGENAIKTMEALKDSDPRFHFIYHQKLSQLENSAYFQSLDADTQALFRDLGIGRNAGGRGNDSTTTVTEFMSPSNNAPFFNRDIRGQRGSSLADLFMPRQGTNAVRGRQ